MITIFGSTNLDQIGTVTRLPSPGETVAGGTFSVSPGGKGANQALAARRAGSEVRHVSAVGNDVFAQAALELLKADGVDLNEVKIAAEPTGIAMILVDAQGENVIAVLPGANGTLSPADADAALSGLQAGSVLLLQQEIPQDATQRALELARERGAISILNTAPFLPTTAAIAAQANILVANESEFALLCGESHADIMVAMQDWAIQHNQTVIVTLGGDGARAATPEGVISVPALPITPVDTVGAGDTFCGYLAAGLDAGLSLEAAVRRATAAASLACLKPGAQPAIPRAAELEPYGQ
ncbi:MULTISPECIES: ribokinase [unclassified Devosia]|uniref:ribokinase n=1 Tax=unclassified Devosia TaxID=196773 RepID=UPI0015533A95|nr:MULTISPECIES: ribokinase [unclassified Devosia]